MTIKLEGSHNGQNFPTLKIHLSHGEKAMGYLHVRFPEGIDAWRRGDGKHFRFYQDIRSPVWPAKLAAEPVQLPVKWAGNDRNIGYEMALDNGMVLKARARVEEQRIVLSYDLTNNTDIDMANIVIWSCVQLQLAPPLRDFLLERTGVPVAGKFRLIRDLIPEIKPYTKEQAVSQRFTAHTKRPLVKFANPKVSPHPGFPDDRSKDIYFWTVPEPIDLPAIGTVSKDGDWSIVTTCKGARRAWTNPGICCHHADPDGGRCKPNATVRVTNSVHAIRGGIAQVAEYMRRLTGPERKPDGSGH